MEGHKGQRRVALIFFCLIAGVVLLWIGIGIYASTRADPGEFGDMFGAVNALFSGLAFAGVILTVWLQSKELKLQRLELEATRAELAGQKEQLAQQTLAMRAQAQDSNFFQLLELFRHRARNMLAPGIGTSNDFWRHATGICHGNPNMVRAREHPNTLSDTWGNLVYGPFEPILGPYFATLAELLDFIASGGEEARTRWSRILRAQLSPFEMVLFFYQALTPWGAARLRGYIEEFHLFRYFPNNTDFPENKIRNWYAASAFDDNQ